MATVVRSLHRFPVKSMLGEDLAECAVGERGLAGDRGYALLDVERATVASAKDPRRWGTLLQCSARYVEEPVPGSPVPPVVITLADGTWVRSDAANVHDVLSAALGHPVRLLREPPEKAQFDEVWPEIEGLAPQGFIDGTRHAHETETGESVSRIALGALAPTGTFFDLAPLHLLTTATLDMLVEAEPHADFDVRRYRPNLLLSGDAPGWAEDEWVGSTFTLGGARLSVSMLAMRCVMTTLAQGGADGGLAPDADTLRTIARRHRREIPGMGTWACAGVYAGVSGSGTVRVGDALTPSAPRG